MIAAVSNMGDFFYTVNSGRNNADRFFLFIMKVVKHLSQENPSWRKDVIFLLDNASYHRSNVNMERYRNLKIPVMFLGPYHFRLAPVEMMFSYIKSRNLNPLYSRISTK